jgi:uncharacterized protein YajQ (UPF0234 family)
LLKSVRDVLESKVAKRHSRSRFSKMAWRRQHIELQQGISQGLVKEITKLLRDNFPKVKSQI